MIVPFIFTLTPHNEAQYLWYFYKWLEVCKAHNWPMIAQEIYFEKPSYFAKMGRREAYDQTRASMEEFSLPKNSDLNRIGQYKIPAVLIDELKQEKGSTLDAQCYLLKNAYKPLVDCICKLIQDIRETYSEPIEAFAVLQHSPSLSAAAAEFEIPVVHLERGTFREQNYIKTAFWDLESLHDGSSIEKRYQQFCVECKDGHIPIFTNKELLSIFLNNDQLSTINRLESYVPSKKLGVILGCAVDPICLSRSFYNDIELLMQAKQKYGIEQILARKHPADPYGAQYPVFSPCMEARGRTSIDFILDCEEIASICSNVSMEAMYYGRKAYTIMPCPSYFPAAHSLKEDALCASNQYLSFYALAYLIPHEFMTDYTYYQWRLSDPSEKEIYFKHMEFYFKKKKIPYSILSCDENSRLEAMLNAQK